VKTDASTFMPKDRKEQEVKVGDFVMIPAMVTEIQPNDEFINVVVETLEPMHPANHKTQLVLNARQIEVVHPSVSVLVVKERPAEDVLKP
jgi:hypothetical protein